ncbi:hypothetical protein LJ656_10095 [Paraburkholderia sp. MMS20-SJTR3]|uniref:Uncharacterized protein n=1 Tax=Paraburkholderia sejongensis TaxID=2886946 RepID=A0ABS8JSQ1_9BURK|nr:hypothetical protein [Paraburkholderia sp. MMS20-SJTR3]MCC8392939.1 hypothetical protein [Paraburkholderia sp. MMS20-SJTR3]
MDPIVGVPGRAWEGEARAKRAALTGSAMLRDEAATRASFVLHGGASRPGEYTERAAASSLPAAVRMRVRLRIVRSTKKPAP